MSHALSPLFCVVVAVLSVIAPEARAQSNDDISDLRREITSPERLVLELRAGPYTPDVGNSAFAEIFGDESGPLLAAEIDAVILRVPYVGLVGVGGGFGWARYTGKAFAAGSNERVDEESALTLLPMSLMATLRVDVLARELGIPFILSAKLGGDFVYWSTGTGERDEADGLSTGLRWALQIALDLDFFDRRAARALDEQWGINHSFLFAEMFGSTAEGSSLAVGDTTWALGLGFVL